jgi:hypothetical protein
MIIKHLRVSMLGAIFLLLSSFMLFSQSTAPKQIEYSGTLTDSSNNLVEGLKTMKFRIYDSFAGGTQLWSETKYNVNFKRGGFRVILGSSTAIPEGIPLNSYLQIEIKNGLEWEVIVPRIEVTGSIYSVSNNSSTASGSCPSDMVYTGSFCIEVERSSTKTSYTDAIEKCALKNRRLCLPDEIRNAYRERATLNLQHFYVASNWTDFEFGAMRCTTARSVVPAVNVVSYIVKGYTAARWFQARVGDTYVPLSYTNVCYPNAFDSPTGCFVFTYYRCCQ